MNSPTTKRKLPPGVRFHPTDVELLLYYLRRMVLGKPLEAGFVAEVDIYQFHPADLKAQAYFSEELNWYFFCSARNKYKTGERRKRDTPCGFWKPTGNDRVVLHKRMAVGKIKTLVFHEGNPAKGVRTNWVMHEYRLEDAESAGVVLCKIFKKGGLGPRNGEQFGAAYNEKDWESTVEHGQISSAEMNEDDPVFEVANINTVEQVHQSSAFDANPSCTNPMTAPEIAPSSRDLVADPYDDKWCPDDFFDGVVDPTAANTITTEQVRSDAVSMVPVQEHIDESFSAAEFGVPPINLADYPHITFDDFCSNLYTVS